MFIVHISYLKSLKEVDALLAEHRAWLEGGYRKNYFIASGPVNPRTGGIILSQLKDREQLEAILLGDPFAIKGVASYDVVEFDPVKFHPDFKSFV